MTFCIITHVDHHQDKGNYLAYAPYVREMNMWLKYVDKAIVVAPCGKTEITAIDIPYVGADIDFRCVKSFDITSFKNLIRSLIILPGIVFAIYKAMKESDHIHLRCAGNMALLGCFVQILFPKKKKTAKYAGNWDPKAEENFFVTVQKWILNNTFLTRNMQVMVYGKWEGSSKNVRSLFTATYTEAELAQAIKNESNEGEDNRFTIGRDRVTNFLFVGTLTSRKRPTYAIDLVEAILQKGYAVHLFFIGEGDERNGLQKYIRDRNLEKFVTLEGNKNKEEVAAIFRKSEFMILPSKIEGWPKAVAEAMFWGCVPVSTPISCVPYMLDNGSRGVLLDLDLISDSRKLIKLIDNKDEFREMSNKAKNWSRNYTMERFEEEIFRLIKD